eukprot:TRINITY_DN5652_c0_g1_i1.p2 TRINITY_DN5652_c0_g1~~TRINITY_DN5652_c0_g1_i1.p2  ORF type:complete len:112 (-),score=12.26 TRINITY_DN5652_c0_g1_i1:279-614(-)
MEVVVPEGAGLGEVFVGDGAAEIHAEEVGGVVPRVGEDLLVGLFPPAHVLLALEVRLRDGDGHHPRPVREALVVKLQESLKDISSGLSKIIGPCQHYHKVIRLAPLSSKSE